MISRFASISCAMFLAAASLGAQTIVVDADPAHVVNRFRPQYALGTTVDRVPSNATDTFFRPDQVQQVLSAGWGVVSYRQNTELFIQAWHWNPKGKWSDPSGKGYFVGDATPTSEPIRHSFGYSLQHRGFTRNGGSEFDGFSRLDDGDIKTYWKSNPYLTQTFTGEPDSAHAQWIVIDLEKPQDINAIRIAWAEPYAREYNVQYWEGSGDAMDEQDKGTWKNFSSGAVANGEGGTPTIKLSTSTVQARYVRVLMTGSSNTCDTHGSSDKRNCVGYAIREVYLGTVDQSGDFHDLLKHTPGQQQTLTYCSSVDPWHEPSDLYVAPDRMESGDQPGFDLFFTSGITRGLPAIVPIALIYGTPEDSAAQMAYLKARKYPISYIEMGEEADGQYMQPEDNAALYIQWATAIHKVDPTFKLGGPSFQGVTEDIKAWADPKGRTSWFARFLDYLKTHGHLDDFAFMSFEHYPYDGCETPWENLYQEPELIMHVMDVWRADGLPPNIPLLDTETNDHGGEAAVDIFGALWLGDSFAGFLTAGGQSTHYYHALSYSPPHPACPNSWGTYHMFMVDKNYVIQRKTSQYFGAKMLTQEWVQPGDAEHQLFRATSDIKDAAGHTLVTAYPLLRPDGKWSILLINKDRDHPHEVQITFRNSGAGGLRGAVEMVTFGKAQYQWHPDRKNGYADPDGPPVTSKLTAGEQTRYTLPPASINVLREVH
ncbi:Galactose-binding superfamily protein [Candidatus Koribacter versatilis Ellin345]|uniref:Galactose-binding superfamily protein n=1 Tax=Koribacter versatilis (strain Ellin345) TaxID=204669 RepID=Q1IUL5_KORVE|nr:discoidin domain-containing protein [Candidatus Koribacter versatilis]ABF39435.1 Galactose-binding superfamily protein [Candidatus Koribacter versatilis Ellin345]